MSQETDMKFRAALFGLAIGFAMVVTPSARAT
jgi:hypothetical protein